MIQQLLLLVVVILLTLILLTLWAVLYQLVKQQGRLLLHLDNVENRFVHFHEGLVEPSGLAVGTEISPFRLPDINGRIMGLEEFKGKHVLLIHWSPHCGYCDHVAPDLAGLHRALKVTSVEMLLISHGDANSNRKLADEHGLECPILLLDDSGESLDAFANLGTPVAYLLDEQGRVTQPVAIGADKVVALASQAASNLPDRRRLHGEKPLSQSRIERNGLKAGTAAPGFSLPDIDGGTVSLQDYAGKRLLLVFTDPHCGPCDQLAPRLVRLHNQFGDNGLSLLMVGRGEMEENRSKAKEYGIEFPVVVQERWKLSRQYGIFGAPVAFLIDEHGIIKRNVARGVRDILSLAHEALVGGKEIADGQDV